MPGCTAPNCSNSSQKGFKLYHFPSDPERCAAWVKNCGREVGWLPTRHTCVCESHFEESQFETHRADGLRKLKPFAIPTKFNHSVLYKKRRNSESGIIDPKSELKKNVKHKRIAIDSTPSNKDASQENSKEKKNYVSTSKFGGKRAKSAGFKRRKSSTNESRKSASLEEIEEIVIDNSTEESDSCFICGRSTMKRIPLNIQSETSKICLNQKLVQLVAQDFDLLVEDSDSICTNCAQILNCIDYIEIVHSTLSKGILNLIKKKFGMNPIEETNILLYMKTLKNLRDFTSCDKMVEFEQLLNENVESGTSGLENINQYNETGNQDNINQTNKALNVNKSNLSSKPFGGKVSTQSKITLEIEESKRSSNTLELDQSNHLQINLYSEESNHSSKTVHLEDPYPDPLSNTSNVKKSNQAKEMVNRKKSNQSRKALNREKLKVYRNKLYESEMNCSKKPNQLENMNQSYKTLNLEGPNQSDKTDNVESDKIELKESATGEEYKCKICSYNAKCKSFLIFHLRQHFQKLYSCDFCTAPVVLDSESHDRKTSLSDANNQMENLLKRESSTETLLENIDKSNIRQSLLPLKSQAKGQTDCNSTLVKDEYNINIKEEGSKNKNTPKPRSERELTTSENEITKDESGLATSLPPVHMEESTLFRNLDSRKVKDKCKSSLTERSGSSEISFSSANNIHSDSNHSDNDLMTYSFLENYDDPSVIDHSVSGEENAGDKL